MTVPAEDKKKVDVALLSTPHAPSVFMELKPPGGISDLPAVEQQLRNYNRDITAPFSIITDGRTWRFYHSLSAGEFSKKLFKTADLVSDNLDDLERTFQTFLAKSSIETGMAADQAQALLKLNQKQRAMEECLPEARRKVQQAPFPSLPEALVQSLEAGGYAVSLEEAREFVTSRPPPEAVPQVKVERTVFPLPPVAGLGALTYTPDQPPNLHHTKIIDGRIGGMADNDWNGLVRKGIQLALRSGIRPADLSRNGVTAQVKEGCLTLSGFQPIKGTSPQLSIQGMDSSKAWQNILALAKCLRVPVYIRFIWREKEGAQDPGKEGLLEWRPD